MHATTRDSATATETACEPGLALRREHAAGALEQAAGTLAKRISLARRTEGRTLVVADLPADSVERILARGLAELRSEAAALWERPALRATAIALGRAVTLRGEHDTGLFEAKQAVRRLTRDAVVIGPTRSRPRLFGGARFDAHSPRHDASWDAFGGWQFFLPEVQLVIEGDRRSGWLAIEVEAAEGLDAIEGRVAAMLCRRGQPARTLPARFSGATGETDETRRHAFKNAVRSAVAEIDGGDYAKVVLARQVRETLDIDAGEVVERLAERYPACFVFKFATAEATWTGASPELLVSLEDGAVRATSLAGSRGREADPQDDRRAMEELLADPKERSEHAFVAEALHDSLSPLCADLAMPETPRVISLPNIHHLYTPLDGLVAEGVDILDLAAAVHPTPAVGGFPRAEALEAIRRLENMDRGWYAGPIGWVDFDGEGEFAVALRSGLLGEGEAVLFAGAGIVAESVPARELAETEVKLRPLREALSGR